MRYFKRTALLALMMALPALAAEPVKVGLASLPPGLGNPFTSSARTSFYTWRAVYDTLTQLGPDVAPAPGLALAWRNDGATTWVLELRKGASFSNGEPFNAEAAAATFTYLMSPAAVQDSSSRDVANIAAVRALDEDHLEIVTRTPDPMLPRLLAAIAIVPPVAWNKLGREGFAKKPIGTGPFMVERWDDARVSMKAFAGSWRAPKSDQLQIIELPETSTRIQALLSGQIHVASEVGPEDLDLLEGAGFIVYQRPSSSVGVIALHAKPGTPLGDARVRLAMNYAIDVAAINATLLHGLVKPPSSVTPSTSPEHNPDLKPYGYDPARAKALLKEAGYPNGFKITAAVSIGTAGSHAQASYEKAAADLAAVGIRMEIRQLPWSQWVRGVLQGDWQGEAFAFEYETLPTGEAMRPFRLHSCSWPHPWYCDPETEPLIGEAKSTFDAARRMQLVHQIQANYHRKAAAVLLYEQIGLDGVSPKLQGYTQMNGIIPYQDLVVAP